MRLTDLNRILGDITFCLRCNGRPELQGSGGGCKHYLDREDAARAYLALIDQTRKPVDGYDVEQARHSNQSLQREADDLRELLDGAICPLRCDEGWFYNPGTMSRVPCTWCRDRNRLVYGDAPHDSACEVFNKNHTEADCNCYKATYRKENKHDQ